MQVIARRSIVLTVVLAFSGVLLLSACGQKGPLYLPEKDKQEQQQEQGSGQ